MEPRSVGATLTAAVTATTGDILTKQAFSVSLNVFSVKAAIISPFNHPLTHRGDTKLDSFHSPSGGGGVFYSLQGSRGVNSTATTKH